MHIDGSSTKYQVNPDFNSGVESAKEQVITLLPSHAERQEEDSKKIESLGLSTLAGGVEDTAGGKTMQNKFLDNQRYRIDARVVKNLKRQKRMKVKDLVEVVIEDLNLHMSLDENQE